MLVSRTCGKRVHHFRQPPAPRLRRFEESVVDTLGIRFACQKLSRLALPISSKLTSRVSQSRPLRAFLHTLIAIMLVRRYADCMHVRLFSTARRIPQPCARIPTLASISRRCCWQTGLSTTGGAPPPPPHQWLLSPLLGNTDTFGALC